MHTDVAMYRDRATEQADIGHAENMGGHAVALHGHEPLVLEEQRNVERRVLREAGIETLPDGRRATILARTHATGEVAGLMQIARDLEDNGDEPILVFERDATGVIINMALAMAVA